VSPLQAALKAPHKAVEIRNRLALELPQTLSPILKALGVVDNQTLKKTVTRSLPVARPAHKSLKSQAGKTLRRVLTFKIHHPKPKFSRHRTETLNLPETALSSLVAHLTARTHSKLETLRALDLQTLTLNLETQEKVHRAIRALTHQTRVI
jgi:hypothetical protein